MTPSQSTSLLPCPFCNGAAELRECGGWSGVGCNTNKCPALLHALMFKTAAEAASTWNRRAAATLRGMEKEAPRSSIPQPVTVEKWPSLEALELRQATPHTDHPAK